MNEDFFAVVEALLTNCSGGGMVIGDDDQDILAWNRIAWRRRHRADCPVEAVDYFERFRASFAPEQVSLTINYRSTQEIVERADLMVQRAAEGIGFSRVKRAGRLVAANRGNGLFELFSGREESFLRIREAVRRGDHLAVLCRSNRECLEVHEQLLRTESVDRDKIELLGAEDFNLYKLRASGALLDLCEDLKDYEFVDRHTWQDLLEKFRREEFADMDASLQFLDVLYGLIREEIGRPTIRDLREFILEMRSSDVERLKPRIGARDVGARITVATVHKVKGLEYDTVVVLPSSESFPFTDGHHVTIAEAAAEEARLYYVAMTRARTHFYGGWGPREKAWWGKRELPTDSRASGYRLKGSPKEIWVSLPGHEEQVDGGLQRYIESQVCRGDALRFRGRQFLHGATPVGVLSKATADKLRSNPSRRECRVANVIRYTCGPFFQEHNLKWWQELHPTVQRRGWFYVVLVEEG
jgi:superfamily I DNA/RNA helicase